MIYWGEVIGTHGSDIVSYNLETKIVTLWDAKYRGKAVGLAGSKTFVENSGPLNNALSKAVDAVKMSNLTEADKLKALESIRIGNYSTRTVGAGEAKNSTLDNRNVQSK